MTQTELIPLLINNMNTISAQMSNIIYKGYFDKAKANNKYILSMFDDAFKTTDVICYSFTIVALTQAGDLIRKLIEQVAIVSILTNNPDKLPKYVEHYKLRKDIANKGRKEQRTIIINKYNLNKKINPFNYLDYGWIEDNCDEYQMFEKTGFADFAEWKRIYLNKFVHSVFTNLDLAGNQHNFPIIKPLVEITAKAFDYLCCAFHKETGFDFVIDGDDLFQREFRKLYKMLS